MVVSGFGFKASVRCRCNRVVFSRLLSDGSLHPVLLLVVPVVTERDLVSTCVFSEELLSGALYSQGTECKGTARQSCHTENETTYIFNYSDFNKLLYKCLIQVVIMSPNPIKSLHPCCLPDV